MGGRWEEGDGRREMGRREDDGGELRWEGEGGRGREWGGNIMMHMDIILAYFRLGCGRQKWQLKSACVCVSVCK